MPLTRSEVVVLVITAIVGIPFGLVGVGALIERLADMAIP
jgi:hypothetical protein